METIETIKLIEHKCKHNATLGRADENKVYREGDVWLLSTDVGCCHVAINFCPYCGMDLYRTIDATQIGVVDKPLDFRGITIGSEDGKVMKDALESILKTDEKKLTVMICQFIASQALKKVNKNP